MADLDVSLEVRPEGFIRGTQAAAGATRELTERTRESGAATRETTSAEERLGEAERRRIQTAAELVRSYQQRITVLAEYQRALASGASAEAASARGQVAGTGIDPRSGQGAVITALIEQERLLRAAVRETAEETARADRVAANLSGLQARTAEMRQALEAALRGTAAERAYSEALELRRAVESSGAHPGTDQAAAVEREVLAQRQLAGELAAVARARERDEAAAHAENAFRDQVSTELGRLREETSQLGQLAAAHRQGAAAVKALAVDLEVRNAILRQGVAAGSADAAAIEKEIRAQARYRQEIQQTTQATHGLSSGSFSLTNAFFALQAAIAILGIGVLIRDSVGLVTQFERIGRSLEIVTGSAQGAKSEIAFLRMEADRLGLVFKSAAVGYSQFAAAAKGSLSMQQIRDVFVSVTEALSNLGASEQQAERALLALQQMASKGTVSAEELRQQLAESLPGAFQLAAKAAGLPLDKFNKMLESGKIMASDLLPKLAVEIRNAFGTGGAAIQTTQAKLNRFKTALDDLKHSFGEGLIQGFLSGLSGLQGALTSEELKRAALELGRSIGEAAKKAADVLKTLLLHLDELKGLLLALALVKTASTIYGIAMALKAAETAAALAKIQVLGLNAAMLATPFGWILLGLAAIAAALVTYTASTKAAHAEVVRQIDVTQDARVAVDLLTAATVKLTEAQRAQVAQAITSSSIERDSADAELRSLQERKRAYDEYQRALRASAPNPEQQRLLQGRSPEPVTGEAIADSTGRYRAAKQAVDQLWDSVNIYTAANKKAEMGAVELTTELGKMDKAAQRAADALQKFKNQAEDAERLAKAEQKGAEAAHAVQQAIERERGAWDALHSIHGLSIKDRERLTGLIEGFIGREQVARQAIDDTRAARERDLSFNREAQQAEAALADALAGTTSRGREMTAQLEAEAIARAEIRSEDAAYIASLKKVLLIRADYLASVQLEIEWAGRQREAVNQQRRLDAELQDARRRDTKASQELVIALEAEEEARKRGVAQGTIWFQLLVAIAAARARDAAATAAQTSAQIQLNEAADVARRSDAALRDSAARVELQRRYGSVVADLAVQLGAASESERQLAIDEATRAEATRQGVLADAAAVEAIRKVIAEQQGRLAVNAAKGKLNDLQAAVYQPLADGWHGALDIGLDVLTKWVTTGKVSGKEIAATFLSYILDMFAEIFRRWVALQVAMKAAQGLGGVGSLATSAGGAAVQGAAGGAAGAAGGAGAGAAGAGAAGAGGYAASGGGALAGWAVVAIYVAIVVAVVLFIRNWIKVHASTRAQIDLAVKDGAFVAGAQKGVSDRLALLKANVIDPLVKSLNDYIKGLGGILESFNSALQITRSGRSKGTKFNVYWTDEYGRRIVQAFGNDAQAALSYSFFRALQSSTISGVDPIVARAVQAAAKRAAESFYKGISDAEKKAIQEEFDRLTAEAQQVAGMGKPEQVQQLGALNRSVDQLVADMLLLLGPSAEFDQALQSITADMVLQMSAQRDSITGRQRTAQEEYQDNLRRAHMWNAEMALRELDLKQRIVEQKVKISDAEITMANTQATLGHARVSASAAGLLVDSAERLAAATEAAGGMTQAQLDNMRANLAALEAILANMPKPISDEEIKKPGKGGKSGGGGGGGDALAALLRMIEDFDWQKKVAGMSDYAKGVLEIEKKWKDALAAVHLSTSAEADARKKRDAAIKAAHGDADKIKAANAAYRNQIRHIEESREVLEAANRAREEELTLLRESERVKLRQELAPWLEDFGKSDWDLRLKELRLQMEAARKRAVELGESVDDVALAASRASAALGQQAIAALGLPTDQTVAQMGTLADALAFVRTNAHELGITQEELGRITAELGNQLYGSLVDSLLKYVTNEDAKRGLEELRYQMEIANIKLQFELVRKMGVLTAKQVADVQELIDALPDHIPGAGSASGATGSGHYNSEGVWVPYTGPDLYGGGGSGADPQQVQLDAARRFARAVDDYVQATQDLMTDPSLSPLSPEEQLASLQEQFRAAVLAAQGGDADAVHRAQELQQQIAEALLRVYGGGADAQGNAGYIAGIQEMIRLGQTILTSPAAQHAFDLAGAVQGAADQAHRDLLTLTQVMEAIRDELGGDVLFQPNRFAGLGAPEMLAQGLSSGLPQVPVGSPTTRPPADRSGDLLEEIRGLRRDLRVLDIGHGGKLQRIAVATEKTAGNTKGDGYAASRAQSASMSRPR